MDGEFYDLMYVNPSSEYFNNEKQFAFLRKKEDELLIVVVNFDDKAVDIKVRIPSHALEYLGIPDKKYKAKDLLTGDKQDVTLASDCLVPVSISERGARLYKVVIK